eukprot:745708-Hanusia_phi.AAC.1
MNVEEVNFIGKMILDEVMELLATVMRPEVAKDVLKTFIDQRYTRRLMPIVHTAYSARTFRCSRQTTRRT